MPRLVDSFCRIGLAGRPHSWAYPLTGIEEQRSSRHTGGTCDIPSGLFSCRLSSGCIGLFAPSPTSGGKGLTALRRRSRAKAGMGGRGRMDWLLRLLPPPQPLIRGGFLQLLVIPCFESPPLGAEHKGEGQGADKGRFFPKHPFCNGLQLLPPAGGSAKRAAPTQWRKTGWEGGTQRRDAIPDSTSCWASPRLASPRWGEVTTYNAVATWSLRQKTSPCKSPNPPPARKGREHINKRACRKVHDPGKQDLLGIWQ